MVRIGRIVVLWGAHRTAPSRTGSQPTSIDKGIPELASLGFKIYSIYPGLFYADTFGWFKFIVRRRGARFFSIISLLLSVRNDDVIYTVDHKWAVIVSLLKKHRIIRNRFVFKWAGFDFDWSRTGCRASIKKYLYRGVLKYCEVVFFASFHQLGLAAKSIDAAQKNLRFWPTAVDTRFYKNFESAGSNCRSGLVAVGSDSRRDWSMMIEIARRGIAVTILTDDPLAKSLIEDEGANCPSTLRLEYDVGMRRSAKIMSEAKAVIIATLANERFSGSTTVGVAAALGKPLILDEPYDIKSYGLIPGHNCEVFQRGDIDSALQAIDRIYGAADHAQDLATNITAIADDLDIRHFANALASALNSSSECSSFPPETRILQSNPCP